MPPNLKCNLRRWVEEKYLNNNRKEKMFTKIRQLFCDHPYNCRSLALTFIDTEGNGIYKLEYWFCAKCGKIIKNLILISERDKNGKRRT